MKYNFLDSIGHRECSSKRDIYSDTGVPQETRIISNKLPNLPSKGIRRRGTKKVQSQQKEGNNKY